MSEHLKYPPSPRLGAWLVSASKDMRERLYELSARSENMLRQWVTGRRAPSAASAGAIEECTLIISKEFPDAPEPVTRGDLCETCRNCNYFQAFKTIPVFVDSEDDTDNSDIA